MISSVVIEIIQYANDRQENSQKSLLWGLHTQQSNINKNAIELQLPSFNTQDYQTSEGRLRPRQGWLAGQDKGKAPEKNFVDLFCFYIASPLALYSSEQEGWSDWRKIWKSGIARGASSFRVRNLYLREFLST